MRSGKSKKNVKVGLLNAIRSTASNSLDMIAASALINVIALAVPLTIMQVYDRIIPYNATGSLMWLILGASIAVLFEAILKIVRDQIGAWIGARYEYKLSSHCFEQILRADLDQVEDENLNTLMEKLASVATLRSSYCQKIYTSLLDLPFAFIYVATIWIIFPKLAYFVAIIAAILCLTSILSRPIYRRIKFSHHAISNNRLNYVIDSIKKIHLIKAFSFEEQMLRKFEDDQYKLSAQDQRVNLALSLPSDFHAMIGQLTLFGALIVGAAAVIDGSITIGVLVTGMLLSSRAIQPFQSLSAQWIKFGDVDIAREKIDELANLVPMRAYNNLSPNDIDGGLEIKGVSYCYGQARDDVILGLNLEIMPREFIAFTGHNFIETSTLLEILSGIRKANIGTITIEGHNLEYLDRDELGKVVEYVPLNASILRGSILDNIARFNPENRLTARQMADNLNLDQWASKLAKGYNTMIDRESHAILPNSFIQLMSLARALVANPKILFIDRLDVGLDQEGKFNLKNTLAQLKGQCTVVLVSEDSELLGLASKVFRFEGNSAYEMKSSGAALEDRSSFAEYWSA